MNANDPEKAPEGICKGNPVATSVSCLFFRLDFQKKYALLGNSETGPLTNEGAGPRISRRTCRFLIMNKLIVSLAISLLLTAGGCSSNKLTDDMKQKLDPPLIRLVEDQPVSESDYDQTVRPDGEKEYGVIIRGTDPEEVRAMGIHLNSIFGEVMTARLTREELVRVIRLSSVESVRAGDKPRSPR